MDHCKHVIKLKPSRDHSILNPQKWHCEVCETTESVWACLSCPYVACGRYISEHALKHYEDSKHPLTMEVNEKYVYCYECEDYVLNDNAAGDIKILRSCLRAIATQSFQNMSSSHHRVLRSYSYSSLGTWQESKRLHSDDQCYTALWFRRYYLLAKAFSGWKKLTPCLAKKKETAKSSRDRGLPRSCRKKLPMVAGVTGLRNLGNTCYMNSILQVLSNLQEFRQHFLRSQALYSPGGSTSTETSPSTSTVSLHTIQRQTTMECFQHINEGNSPKGGLNGGSSRSPAKKRARSLDNTRNSGKSAENLSLCQELHALLRVMWSGKWALVSPHKMLQTVWSVIPFFKGYTQQDAQEFLSEFLDKVQNELERLGRQKENGATAAIKYDNPPSSKTTTNTAQTTLNTAHNTAHNTDVVDNLFQGELVSEVKCLRCGHISRTYEPFMDLSLDFPGRYHWHQNQYKVCVDSCPLKEMLTHFTEVEKLEGRIYACEQCNTVRRRYVSAKPTVFSEAEKRFLITKLPRVLRLHLKRFTWAGRNHRGKIPVHVNFEEELDMGTFRPEDADTSNSVYRLVAVVMHHGRGFGSGHYTSYCWNTEAVKSSTSFTGAWIHCNDAKMALSHWDDVSKAQAYILIYVHKDFSYVPDPSLLLPMEEQRSMFETSADSEITFNFKNSSIPKFVELKRRLSEDLKGQYQLKRRKSNIW